MFDAAIGATVLEAEGRLARLDGLAERWEQRIRGIETAGLNIEAGGERPSDVLTGGLRELREKFKERASHLERINIVLFGRTGAGKSSLVEALSGGDGKRISPDGRLDHTREVSIVRWEGCDLIDTPGIEGWAESSERERIERNAHAALKRADLVVLGFDDYNQKAGEFRQIARWVGEAGKAAVAVLNVRDDSWRFDERLWDPGDRDTSASQVRSHAGHIERLLAEIGLQGIPVIAVNSLWAFGARANDPSGHPAADEIIHVLSNTSRDDLARISNITALMALFAEVLRVDPVGFRLGALDVEQVSGLRTVARDLNDAAKLLDLLGSQRETRIERVVQRAGFSRTPPPDLASNAGRELVERFGAALERLADEGGVEIAAVDGEVLRWAQERVQDALLAERHMASKRVGEVLSAAASERRSVSATELQATAFGDGFTTAAVNAATAALHELETRLLEDAEDLELDFALNLEDIGRPPGDLPSGYDVSRGQQRRWAGRAIGLGGALGGALFLLSNPVGWTMAGGLVLAGLAQVLGSRLRKGAHRKLREERLRAEREVLRWLDGVIDDLRAQTQAWVAWEGTVRAAGFAPLVHDATTLRRLATISRRASRALAREARKSSSRRPAQAMLAAAAITVEQQRFGDNPAASRMTWLGEDWLDQPLAEPTTPAPRLLRERLGDGLALTVPDISRTELWWRAAEDAAAELEEVDAALARARAVREARPIVAFLGDYSSGKTSLACRLAAEMGVVVDRTELAVDAAPTTARPISLDIGVATLCDTPGLQSEHAEHETLAADAVAGAALLVAVHTPAAGKLDALRRILCPRTTPVRVGRTIHVLARIDDLTARPLHDPGTFLRLLEAKRSELRRRLVAAGFQCDGNQPLPLAADPGRRHAAGRDWTKADFDTHRGWDGVDDLLKVLVREAANGAGAAGLDRAATDLTRLTMAVTDRSSQSRAQQRERRRVIAILERAERRHKRLEHAAQSRLRALVEDQLAERHDRLASMDRRRLEQLAAAPEEWLVTDEFIDKFAEWRELLASDFASLYADLGGQLDARVGSRAFEKAFGEGAGLESILRESAEGLKVLLAKGAGDLGEQGGKVVADVLARIPQLAPYAARLGQVGARAVAATAGLLIEGLTQFLESRAAKRHQRELENTLLALRDASERWVDETFAGTEANPGVLDEVLALKERVIVQPLDAARESADVADGAIERDDNMLERLNMLIGGADDALAG